MGAVLPPRHHHTTTSLHHFKTYQEFERLIEALCFQLRFLANIRRFSKSCVSVLSMYPVILPVTPNILYLKSFMFMIVMIDEVLLGRSANCTKYQCQEFNNFSMSYGNALDYRGNF